MEFPLKYSQDKIEKEPNYFSVQILFLFSIIYTYKIYNTWAVNCEFMCYGNDNISLFRFYSDLKIY